MARKNKPSKKKAEVVDDAPTLEAASAVVIEGLPNTANLTMHDDTDPVEVEVVAPKESTRKFADGRRAALEALDVMLARTDNIRALSNSLQDSFDKDPTLFFKEVVMPLTPKESLVKLADQDGKAPVRIIFEQAIEAAIAPEGATDGTPSPEATVTATRIAAALPESSSSSST